MAEQEFIDKYELLLCIQCAKCTGGCPISLRTNLNIRKMIRQCVVRENLAEVLAEEEIWDCTACSNCVIRCPRGIKPMEALIGLRGMLVEEGRIPATARDALESVFKQGNPWGRARAKRADWAQGLEIKDFSQGDKAELLLFVGCTPAYDTRVQEVAKALVKIFQKVALDFAILGTEESCCGSEVRRMGEAGLFEMLKEDNSALFKKYGITKMVTISPHCYNVFKNECDGGFEVKHYAQLLADLIEQKKLNFSNKLNQVVTYHDPCFLGKQNKVFEAPREVIKAIPGVSLVEMNRIRERSLCCEGGGGRMWIEGTGSGERLAAIRVREALGKGAETIITCCPFCLINLEDAVKTSDLEDKLEVVDLAELIWQAIQ
jgi:Fe-S oxidoreductase